MYVIACIYSRECLSRTEFFVGLEASGEIETVPFCKSVICAVYAIDNYVNGQRGPREDTSHKLAWKLWPKTKGKKKKKKAILNKNV